MSRPVISSALSRAAPPMIAVAVLVVVEDRNPQCFPQRLLDEEALRRADVLEVDAADRRLQHLAEADDFVRILGGDLDVEDVDSGELLEEDALALHDRLGREWPDVPQPEDGRSIRNHRNQVPARRVAKGLVRAPMDGHARLGNARTVRQGQVPLGGNRLRGNHLYLPRAPLGVVLQGVALECRQVFLSSPRVAWRARYRSIAGL